ncbi:hypothetical protein Q7P37_006853 [Cladosporium fusiforme]
MSSPAGCGDNITDSMLFNKIGQRRPVPLTLELGHDLETPYSQRTDDPTALQDAAVKSATSLIAVVNDMLRSPHSSAPLHSGLAPNYGRPRSHTAPPTPMPEAPSHPPVELPGSIPDRPRAAHHHSFDGNLKSVVGPMHQDRRRSTHPWLQLLATSKDKVAATEHSAGVTNECTAPRMRHPQKIRKDAPAIGSRMSKGSLPSTEARSYALHFQEPERSTVSLDQALHDTNPLTLTSAGQSTGWSQLPLNGHHLSQEEPLMAQMCALRGSHEAQLQALRESHRQEVASNHQYISFLENHYAMRYTEETHPFTSARPGSNGVAQKASEDSFRPSTMGAIGMSSVTLRKNTTPTLQNITHAEALGVKHGSHCQSTAKCGEVWLECERLRAAARASTQDHMQLRQTVQRLQASEKSLHNTVAGLQSRLSAANNSRLDVEEGYHEACEQVRKLTGRETNLLRDIETLQSGDRCKSDAPPSEKMLSLQTRSRHGRTRSDVSLEHNKSKLLLAQIEDLQKLLSEKDDAIQQLELRCQEYHAQCVPLKTHTSASYSDVQLSNGPPIKEIPTKDIVTPTLAGLANSDITQTPPAAPSRMDRTANDYGPTHEANECDLESSESNLQQDWQNKSQVETISRSSPTASPTPSPSLSPTRTPSPSALGISLPQTPRTVSSATAEALLLTTEDPYSFTQPRTPPLCLHKKPPKPPLGDTSPPPAYSPALRRGETMKSVGESIIELYARREGDGWGRCADGWVEWV